MTCSSLSYGIARNVLYEHIRQRMRDAMVEPDFSVSSIADVAPGLASLASQRAEQRVLGTALQHIPLDMQVLLELYYWEDLQLDELSEMLGVPVGTVKSRLHRARALLREAMEGLPATPEERVHVDRLLEQWAARVRDHVAAARSGST